MSSHLPLQEYRCSCGKLLFKGMLALCSVEIKCRRCGGIAAFERFDLQGFLFISSDREGRVEEVFSGAEAPADGMRDYLLGKHVPELYPLLRDKDAGPETCLPASGQPYYIRDNVVLLGDGASVPISSCIVPRRKGGVIDGCYILNWEKAPESES